MASILEKTIRGAVTALEPETGMTTTSRAAAAAGLGALVFFSVASGSRRSTTRSTGETLGDASAAAFGASGFVAGGADVGAAGADSEALGAVSATVASPFLVTNAEATTPTSTPAAKMAAPILA